MPLNCASVRLLNCCWLSFPPKTVDVTMRSSSRFPSRFVIFVTVVICLQTKVRIRCESGLSGINLPHHRSWTLWFLYSLDSYLIPARHSGGSKQRRQRPKKNSFPSLDQVSHVFIVVSTKSIDKFIHEKDFPRFIIHITPRESLIRWRLSDSLVPFIISFLRDRRGKRSFFQHG